MSIVKTLSAVKTLSDGKYGYGHLRRRDTYYAVRRIALPRATAREASEARPIVRKVSLHFEMTVEFAMIMVALS